MLPVPVATALVFVFAIVNCESDTLVTTPLTLNVVAAVPLSPVTVTWSPTDRVEGAESVYVFTPPVLLAAVMDPLDIVYAPVSVLPLPWPFVIQLQNLAASNQLT